MPKQSLKRISNQTREKTPLTKPSATAFLFSECCLSSKTLHPMSTVQRWRAEDRALVLSELDLLQDWINSNRTRNKDSQVVFPAIPVAWHLYTVLGLHSYVYGLNGFPFWKALNRHCLIAIFYEIKGKKVILPFSEGRGKKIERRSNIKLPISNYLAHKTCLLQLVGIKYQETPYAGTWPFILYKRLETPPKTTSLCYLYNQFQLQRALEPFSCTSETGIVALYL